MNGFMVMFLATIIIVCTPDSTVRAAELIKRIEDATTANLRGRQYG